MFGGGAQTVGQREDFLVHLGAEVCVVDQVFVVMRAKERVVAHHLVVDGRDGDLGEVGGFLRVGHPQRVRVLLLTHDGYVLPDLTQGTAVVLHPQELWNKRVKKRG